MTIEMFFALFGGFVLYVAHSAYRPFAACWVCGGNPKHESKRGGSWRMCWFCGGKGSRIRWGRRVYERINPRASKK